MLGPFSHSFATLAAPRGRPLAPYGTSEAGMVAGPKAKSHNTSYGEQSVSRALRYRSPLDDFGMGSTYRSHFAYIEVLPSTTVSRSPSAGAAQSTSRTGRGGAREGNTTWDEPRFSAAASAGKPRSVRAAATGGLWRRTNESRGRNSGSDQAKP